MISLTAYDFCYSLCLLSIISPMLSNQWSPQSTTLFYSIFLSSSQAFFFHVFHFPFLKNNSTAVDNARATLDINCNSFMRFLPSRELNLGNGSPHFVLMWRNCSGLVAVLMCFTQEWPEWVSAKLPNGGFRWRRLGFRAVAPLFGMNRAPDKLDRCSMLGQLSIYT